MAHERTTRLIAAVLLAVFVVGVAGVVPLPASWFAPSADPDAYPCAGHACGCHSIDDCFSGCCCNTEADLIAWLKRTGKQPPSWWKPTRLASSDKRDCPLCEGGASETPWASSCAADSDQACPSSSCPTGSCSAGQAAHRPDGSSSIKTTSGVTTISALSCRGLPMVYLLAAPMFLAGQASLGDLMTSRQVGVIAIDASTAHPSPAREIPTPPPRPTV